MTKSEKTGNKGLFERARAWEYCQSSDLCVLGQSFSLIGPSNTGIGHYKALLTYYDCKYYGMPLPQAKKEMRQTVGAGSFPLRAINPTAFPGFATQRTFPAGPLSTWCHGQLPQLSASPIAITAP